MEKLNKLLKIGFFTFLYFARPISYTEMMERQIYSHNKIKNQEIVYFNFNQVEINPNFKNETYYV